MTPPGLAELERKPDRRVDLRIDGEVATITLDAPSSRVAPSCMLLQQLEESIVAADDATTAQEIGMITSAVDGAETILARLCKKLSRVALHTVSVTKQLLLRVPKRSADAGLAEVTELSQALFPAVEARDGVAAFAYERPPTWTGL